MTNRPRTAVAARSVYDQAIVRAICAVRKISMTSEASQVSAATL